MPTYHLTVVDDAINVLGQWYRGPTLTVSAGAWAWTTGDVLPTAWSDTAPDIPVLLSQARIST
jgi:hypothetical protein